YPTALSKCSMNFDVFFSNINETRNHKYNIIKKFIYYEA
ncbi:hypothetical protein X975_06890, partial [Stegodyphus mimosarum]